ncbi:rootletin-like [Saccostrea echinata]|uniref:rootletin-like n=1 Tax=Saccostrea echinata TaxID=191078 RepID=UPI002A838740|nr:rootletin-like [Saccostrea echinata]
MDDEWFSSDTDEWSSSDSDEWSSSDSDEWSSSDTDEWDYNQYDSPLPPVCASCFMYNFLGEIMEFSESLQEQLRKRDVIIGTLSLGIERERRKNQKMDILVKEREETEHAMVIQKQIHSAEMKEKIDTIKDLQIQLHKVQENFGIKKSQQKIESLERLLKTEKELVQSLKTEICNLQHEIQSLKLGQHPADLYTQKESEILQERISKLTAENNKLNGEIEKISKENDNLVKRLREREQAYIDTTEMHKENESLQEDNKRLQNQLNIFQEEIVRLTSERKPEIILQLKRTQAEIEGLKEKIYQLTTDNNMLHEEIEEISREKDNALTRLSKIAGAKLTHGNAAITDLSDTNRPTKITEKFSELYDNQWTDAFEELNNTYNNEEETIQVLLKILKDAYDFCVHTEQTYGRKIEEAVFTLQDETTEETCTITCADVPVQKALADLRLSLSNACCPVIEKMFLARLPSILKNVDISVSPKTKLYARQCASLCWRMKIRDPPLFVRFEFRRGTEFNTDILRRYTKTGGYLDFIVWPALYLHEKGPLLSKGVAQPKHSP